MERDRKNRSFERLQAKSEVGVAFLSKRLKELRRGGIVTLVSTPEDPDTKRLINLFSREYGIGEVVAIDLKSVVTSLEYGVNLSRFGIPEKDLCSQTLVENVFQIVYKKFGLNGLRFGLNRIMETIEREIERGEFDLRHSAFADVIDEIDFTAFDESSYGPKRAPRLIVAEFPVIFDQIPTTGASVDALSKEHDHEISKYMHIYSLLTTFHPDRYSQDSNPYGDVFLSSLDASLFWSAARQANRWYENYLLMCSVTSIKSASFTEADNSIRWI